MSSNDINLTTGEIAKAFQILRKYRYTFSTPERKASVIHKDAESLSAMTSSTERTLPYLDLADSLSSQHSQKKQSVVDWVDGIGAHQVVHAAGLLESNQIITESHIDQYCSQHPLHRKVSVVCSAITYLYF